jgi:tetraacyldisaccharide 4'-kinase
MKSEAAQRPPMPFPLGPLAEPIYRAVVAGRNRAFDAGRGVMKLGVPVISIGNLSVGGTGKTPMVAAIVRWLLHAERRPCIAMRGYAKRPGNQSDEEAEYRAVFPSVPVVAQPDRAAGIRPLIEHHEIDCVVLDDGFQHRQIARETDIVLIDCTRDPFADRCLPAGWLREPVESLRRASAVVLTHCEAASAESREGLIASVGRVTGRAPLAHARHSWDGLRVNDGREDVAWLRGRAVVAACAIGNPGPFLSALRAAGASITHTEVRRDHHPWSDADAVCLAASARSTGASGLVTTEKDWVKLVRHIGVLGGMPIARPVLSMRFDHGADALRCLALSAFERSAPDHGAAVAGGAQDA